MALPKGKISKSRGRMRRANWKLSAPGIVKCPRCQQMKLAHRILQALRLLRWQAGHQHGSRNRFREVRFASSSPQSVTGGFCLQEKWVYHHKEKIYKFGLGKGE